MKLSSDLIAATSSMQGFCHVLLRSEKPGCGLSKISNDLIFLGIRSQDRDISRSTFPPSARFLNYARKGQSCDAQS
jgi:hypothetical protein